MARFEYTFAPGIKKRRRNHHEAPPGHLNTSYQRIERGIEALSLYHERKDL